MNLIATAPQWLVLALFLLLLLASAEDAWRLRISNMTSGAIAIGAFLAVALDGPIVGLWQNVLLFAAVLTVGTFLFGRGWMGGGDVKLLAGCALWFDLSSGWKALVAIALVGGVEAVAVILLRKLPWPDGWRQQVLLLKPREGIPYGIAIALGVASMAVWLRN
jgi:prepilin peptidase CpaA